MRSKTDDSIAYCVQPFEILSETIKYKSYDTEQYKKIHTHQVGSKYDTYRILVADMHVEDKNGKTRHKTFRYTKEYDNVKPGDKATVLRFVDKPIITFQK